MRIAVFGASGAIGRLVTQKALAHGHQVTAYVRRADAFPEATERLAVVVGTLGNQASIEEVVSGADAVISALGPSMSTPRKWILPCAKPTSTYT